MAQAVKLLKVGELEVKGEKKTRMARIEVLTLDTKETLQVTCFLGKGEPSDIVVGSDYEAEIEEGAPYKGRKQYSVALWKMKEMPHVDPVKDDAEADKAMWDQKEMRGHRRACLAIASGLLTEKMKDKLGTPDVEIVGMTQMVANKLLAYVYDEPFINDAPIMEEPCDDLASGIQDGK